MKIFWILVSLGAVVWFVFWTKDSKEVSEVPATVETSQQEEVEQKTEETDTTNSTQTQPIISNKKVVNGMTIEIIKEGTGAGITNGQTAVVEYKGMLTDGTVFDASAKHGQPFSFQLGAGMVIAGWEQGVLGMKVGEVRKLTIPPQLAYGERGAGALIPPNATLVFEVTLSAIK